MAKSVQATLMVVIFAILSLLSVAMAAEAPAPSPTAAAGMVSPSLAGGIAVAIATAFFGSFL
ncbi:hypothetical protein SOVF_127290 [Spinacia oleracea]|nr:hypothetical protein SOVF_127290 [Spinacia oleracea]